MNNKSVKKSYKSNRLYLTVILSLLTFGCITFVDIELAKSIIQSWPLALLVFALLFKKDIKVLMVRIGQISFMVGNKQMNLDLNDTGKLADKMLKAMDNMLKKNQLKIFSKILLFVKNGTTPTVFEVFDKELKRDEDGNPMDDESREILTSLRSLRGFDLIQPAGGRRDFWKNDSGIVITEFAQFILEHDQLNKLFE